MVDPQAKFNEAKNTNFNLTHFFTICKFCSGFNEHLSYFKDGNLYSKINFKNRGCMRSEHKGHGKKGWKGSHEKN